MNELTALTGSSSICLLVSWQNSASLAALTERSCYFVVYRCLLFVTEKGFSGVLLKEVFCFWTSWYFIALLAKVSSSALTEKVFCFVSYSCPFEYLSALTVRILCFLILH